MVEASGGEEEVSQAEFNSYILPFSQDDPARTGLVSDAAAVRTRFEWRAPPKSSAGSSRTEASSALFKTSVRLPPRQEVGPASNSAKSIWW